MEEKPKSPVPAWYWVVAVLALLWNLMGCAVFATEMFAQETMIADWEPEQKEYARSIPGWIYVVFAVAVGTGVARSVGLSMRSTWTLPVFGVTLASVLVQMIYTILILPGLRVMGPSHQVMPSLVVVFAGVLLWFAWFAKGKGWLA